jgi:hypothetical protein
MFYGVHPRRFARHTRVTRLKVHMYANLDIEDICGGEDGFPDNWSFSDGARPGTLSTLAFW